MIIVRVIACTLALVVGVAGGTFAADSDYCEKHREGEPALCSYEPTTIGYTYDSDDSGFMDFKVSVRYQMFADWFAQDSALYFAFTGRFGQYIKSRDSSPVVEKLFNPKLFYRYWTDKKGGNYVDVAFAHQSNGQSIDSPAEYQAALAAANSENEAKDQLSRGWDYWEIVVKKTIHEWPEATAASNGVDTREKPKNSVVSYVGYKYFLTHGPLEGRQENYNAWENDPEGKRLDRVSGLSLMLKWIERGTWITWRNYSILSDLKTAVRFETGVRDSFRDNTYRIEIGTKVLQVPIVVWRQIGYNSDLAQYYKKVNSWGVQLEIGSF